LPLPLIHICQDDESIRQSIKNSLSRLESGQGGVGDRRFDTFESGQSFTELVSHIIELVAQQGDLGVVDCLKRIDKADVQADSLVVTQDELDQARAQVPAELEAGLQLMAQRIKAYAKEMMPKAQTWFEHEKGHKLGFRFTPIDNCGAYVPGGLGGSTPLISTVLMNLIPAKVAGVKNIVVATPCGIDGSINPCLLRACEIAGATTIYRAGGAQGVAAMALGTQTCPPCSKIIGPGNAFVQEAKRQLFGKIDIDMMAGPSEVAIIADEGARPEVVAADLIAQAEHDPMASSFLFTTSSSLMEGVKASIEEQLKVLPKADIARESLAHYGALCLCSSMDEACTYSDLLAPEHLELSVAEPSELLPKLQHAGAIFMGYQTAEVAGDYTAGPSHTLPTCGAARFTSGISVYSFLKSSSLLEYTREAMASDLPALAAMARAENLEGHARSAEIRFEDSRS
jgi:histidinol dehydrogenase